MTRNNHSIGLQDDSAIDAAALRRALYDSLSVLGNAVRESIIEDLKESGISLNDDSETFSFEQICEHLESLFEAETAQLLAERLRNALQEDVRQAIVKGSLDQ